MARSHGAAKVCEFYVERIGTSDPRNALAGGCFVRTCLVLVAAFALFLFPPSSATKG
jgi:hypothetical protein